jgi:cyclohexa-1,5-dienecarbonyl-CoA hydratase
MSDAPLKAWLEREGALLRLRLTRPKANVIDQSMITALSAALAEHRPGHGLLAALLDAEGPNFSFGASVEEHLPGHCAAMLGTLHALILQMLEWPAPILVAIRGQCLGGGLEIALTGSLIFASSDARFAQPEIQLGVFAPAASCLLPPRIGQWAAEDLLLSGRRIDAAEAKALGLVHRIAADPEIAALEYFDLHYSGKSAAALGCAVAAARSACLEELRRQLNAVEHLYLQGLMSTRDATEGLEAFLAKRAPRWEHR